MVMETYYRKRSKKHHEHTLALTEEMETEKSSQCPPPVLGRHLHKNPPSSDHHLLFKDDESEMLMMQNDDYNNIEVGCLYEIDHIHLPPRKVPTQLRSIRVAMVCEKTEMSVGIRYPSMESLRAFFSYSARETHPTLDEKFLMETAVASKVLVRLVPPDIFSERKCLEGFWVITSGTDSTGEKEGCLLHLKDNGMVRWGIRRQVKYLGRHNRENINDVRIQNCSSSFVNVVQESQMGFLENGYDERETEEEADDTSNNDDEGSDCEEKVKEELKMEDDEEEEEEGDDEENEDTNKKLKRKRYPFRNLSNKKPKKGITLTLKKKKKNQKKKNKTRFKEVVIRNPKDRWSSQRYKLAEQNLLDVMRAKAATAEKPILRPQLRIEARKRIGDTGLLDHLLKHMAGKLAPGGEERFRRRHNADGAMEYWLESADLVNTRKEAGITDPYWVPPPGWRLGDSPTQDPICARELKLLKDEITSLKGELKLKATKEQLEDEVGRLKREIDELCSNKGHEESQAVKVISSPTEISQKLGALAASLVASKIDLEKEPVILENYKEQLLIISEFVKEIETRIGILISKVDERETVDSTLMDPTECTGDKEKKQMEKQPKSQKQQQEVQSFIAAGAGEESSELDIYVQNKTQTAAEKTEQKAAKIERLKSGFRICKPQGTFLWPNMVNTNNNVNNQMSPMLSPNQQVMFQVEVPTPPSVTSSSAFARPQLPYRHPTSPVKPLAERRGVTVAVSSAPIRPTIMPLISPRDYLPRNVVGSDEKNQNAYCSSSVSNFPGEMVNWLALSSTTLKSSSVDQSTSHGDHHHDHNCGL